MSALIFRILKDPWFVLGKTAANDSGLPNTYECTQNGTSDPRVSPYVAVPSFAHAIEKGFSVSMMGAKNHMLSIINCAVI